MAGELTTTNYGWTKPTVGASTDAWGGYINADLDGIDSIVHGIQTSVPVASTTTPLADGVAAVGTSTAYARADHVHPVVYMGDNRILNGDMRIDQRNNGASGTATGYTVDRWQYASSQASKGAWGRVPAGGALIPLGFGFFLQFQSSSAYTPLATDNIRFEQPIEADMVSDFAWGTVGAQPVTLSFWVNSSLSGTFSGAISNQPSPPTRSYPFSFILVASTWTRVVITIPGDTAGTWVMSGNASGVAVRFDLGCGANVRGPANAWASASYVGVTGAVSVVGTNAATFALTGVKLEIGSVPTPYNRQSLAKSMADCQRYYSTGQIVYGAYAIASEGVTCPYSLPVTMRAAPTLNITSSSGSNNINTPSMAAANVRDIFAQAVVISTAAFVLNYQFTASAEL